MGYFLDIEIHPDDERITDLLLSDPGELFEHPHAGYILALVGGADKEILQWLADKIYSIDSLSGPHVAFSICASYYDFPISVPYPRKKALNRELSGPQLATVRFSDIRTSIEHSVIFPSSGRPSVTNVKSRRLCSSNLSLSDGDTVRAVTYAVDNIARSWDILDNLPCLVIFDALPSNSITLLPLSESNLEMVFQVMRRSISDINRAYRNSPYQEIVNNLYHLFNEVEELKSHRPCFMPLTITSPPTLAERDRFLKEVHLLCDNNDFMGLNRAIYANPWLDLATQTEFIRMNSMNIPPKNIARIISALDFYEKTLTWPLRGDERFRYARLYDRKIRRLLPEDLPPFPCSTEDNKHIRQKVFPVNYRQILHSISEHFSNSRLVESMVERRNEENIENCAFLKRSEYDAKLEEVQEQLKSELSIWTNSSYPRFSSILLAHSNQLGLPMVQKNVTEKNPYQSYAAWFDRMWQVLNKNSKASGTVMDSYSVRRLMDEILTDDATLDAFCIDHFPSIYRRFADGMDRSRKCNILLTHTKPPMVSEALKIRYPKEYQEYINKTS